MIMEMLILLMGFIFFLQNSTLWMSVIMIPLSIMLAVGFSDSILLNGMVSLIFIMIFVGGLLILLVSVTSTTPQEEGSMNLVLMFSFLFISSSTPWNMTEQDFSSENSMFLISHSFFLMVNIMIISLSLVCMSYFFLKYKGLMRVI